MAPRTNPSQSAGTTPGGPVSPPARKARSSGRAAPAPAHKAARTPAIKIPASPTRTTVAVPHAVAAANEAVDQNVTEFSVPFIGKVSLPPVDHMAWYAGVGVLTAVELLEWPVAVLVIVGKALADSRTHRTLRSFGEALEDVG